MLKRNEDAGSPSAAEDLKLPPAVFLAMRDKWIDYVNTCDQLSHATTRVGTFIALRMDATKQNSFWPVKKIAKMVPGAPGRKMSTSTIAKALAELQAENLLIVHRPNRRANQTYWLHLPQFEIRKSKHSVVRNPNRNNRKAE
jgi:hypothetical protein